MNVDWRTPAFLSRPPRTADVVVVGGGVIGTSIALHLATAGAGTVVLLEGDRIGSGASGKSSGMVRQHYSNTVLAGWARRAVDAFHAFTERYGSDPGFVAAPYVMVCGPEDAAALHGNVALQREAGVAVQLLDARQLAELVPSMRVDDLAIASYEPDAGYADALRTTAAFASAAHRSGVRVCERCRALELRRGTATYEVVTTAGSVSTGHVVLAAGSGAVPLAASIDVELPIEDFRHEVVVFRVDRQPSSEPLMVSDRITGLVSRPDGLDLRRTGATDVNEGSRPTGPPSLATRDVIRSHATRLTHRFPAIGDVQPARHDSGMYHMTPDAQPILGPVDGVSGLTLAVGFCHGFKLAPVLGELLADGVLGGATAAPELAPFSFARFARGELITPAFGYTKAYAG